uniref:ADP-ribosylation factor-like protein 15 n=1 Tax=Astatotilapia calliptera TaxID=8154 RepID=A0AAX7U3G3_ASTCA
KLVQWRRRRLHSACKPSEKGWFLFCFDCRKAGDTKRRTVKIRNIFDSLKKTENKKRNCYRASSCCCDWSAIVHGLSGADNIKKYWSRYYQGSQGVVFVLDSASSDEDLEAARNELHSALQHPQLCTLPFLILANHQDKPAARTPNQIKKYFELEPLARGKRWILEGSTTDSMEAVKESFGQFISLLEDKDTEPARI